MAESKVSFDQIKAGGNVKHIVMNVNQSGVFSIENELKTIPQNGYVAKMALYFDHIRVYYNDGTYKIVMLQNP